MEGTLEGLELQRELCKRVHKWSISEYKIVLDEDEVKKIIEPLVETHQPNWIIGSPTIYFSNDDFNLDQFMDIIVNRIMKIPGAVNDVVVPYGGLQDKALIRKGSSYENAVSTQLIFRLFKANPNRWFSVYDIGEALKVFETLDPNSVSFPVEERRKNKAIRRYVQNIRNTNSQIKTRRVSQCVEYRYFVN